MSDSVRLQSDYDFRQEIYDATQAAEVKGQINLVVADWQKGTVRTEYGFTSLEDAHSFVEMYLPPDMFQSYIIGGDILNDPSDSEV